MHLMTTEIFTCIFKADKLFKSWKPHLNFHKFIKTVMKVVYILDINE